jgi:putative nucleotidyltransferase with HDIG domain
MNASPFELAKKVQEATGDLPAMPHVAAQALQILSSETSTANDLNRIISQDAALAGRVLRVSNCSFYARNGAVKTLTQAIVTVGFNQVRTILLTAALRNLYPKFGRNEQLLWEHSVGCGLTARVIAKRTRSVNPDQAFLVGLLHDIGKTALLLKLPDRMNPVIDQLFRGTPISSRDLEEEVFGFDHAVVGQLLARKWKFGEDIEEAIGQHHFPEEAVVAPKLSHVVSLADAFCHVLGYGPVRKPDFNLAAHSSCPHLMLESEAIEELRHEVEEAYANERAHLVA